MEERYLIVGLGNPGKNYEDTRHNIGFRIVKAFANKLGTSFRSALLRAKGSIGEGNIQDKKALLLLPLTYMNESGAAVKKCVHYYKIPIDHLIVVTDDVDLPFSSIRLRSKGGCGGHKGLKSIEAHLGTQEYNRMRIGVGRQIQGELADYVLSRFTTREEDVIPDVIERAVQALKLWILEGIETAMQKVNRAGEI